MTIKGDPDVLMKVGHGVLAEPYGYIDRVHKTIDDSCRLPSLAFGIAPSLWLSSAYEDGRSQLAKTSSSASDTFKALAKGLGNVAQAMGGAESANTLVPTKAKLDPTGIASDGSDSFGAQAGVLTTEVMLMVEWVATGGVLAASGALAPTALIAVAAWAMVEPDDGALSRAISGWQSAAEDVDSAGKYLDLAMKPLDSGWPDEDTSKQDFDKWMIPFGQDMDKLKDATGGFGEALAGAVNSVHDVQTEAFISASVALASLIALTVMDAIPFVAAVAEPAKQIIGVVLGIDMAAEVVIIGEMIKQALDTWKATVGSGEGFTQNKPGDHTLPHFEQLKIDWDHE